MRRLDQSDRATILCALRMFQERFIGCDAEEICASYPEHFQDDDGGQIEPLGSDDIEKLCEDFNFEIETTSLDEEERNSMFWAIEIACDDQEHYDKYGNPEMDYGEELHDVAVSRVDHFTHLHDIAEKFGQKGLAEDCQERAESWAELAGEDEGDKETACNANVPTVGGSAPV